MRSVIMSIDQFEDLAENMDTENFREMWVDKTIEFFTRETQV